MYHIILWGLTWALIAAIVIRDRYRGNDQRFSGILQKIVSFGGTCIILSCCSVALSAAAIRAQYEKAGMEHVPFGFTKETWKLMLDNLTYVGNPFQNGPDIVYFVLFFFLLIVSLSWTGYITGVRIKCSAFEAGEIDFRILIVASFLALPIVMLGGRIMLS